MGKQKGNRNRGRQQRRQQQQKQPESTKEPLNPSSVIPRLRHPDSKIRHATLITLQQLFTNGSKKNKSINLSVLQGIREQLVDNDLECSYVASQCLVLYLQQQQIPGEAREDQQQQQQDTKKTEAVASWTPIVLSRLQQCYEAVVPQSQSQPQPQPQQSNQHFVKQWMALSSTCSQLLCLLIETNPVVLERHIMTAQSANTFLNVTIGLLKHVVTPSTPPAAAALTSQQSQHSHAVQSYKDATALYVARSLHSAVDDNFELTKLILTDGINALKDIIILLTIANKTNNPNGGQPVSSMTALHLYGCFINMYQILNYNHDAAAHTIESILLLAPVGEEDEEDGVVAAHTQQKPLLLKQIQSSFSVAINATAGSTSLLSSLESAYRSAQNLRHQQETDETLENEIIRQVADRKEPARQIARRQKETNKQQEDDDVDMEDATTNEQPSNSHSGKITDRQQDGQQAMEDALQEWNSYVEPLQLTLEIISNLVTCWIPSNDDGGDDTMMMVSTPVTPTDSPLQTVLCENRFGPAVTDLLDGLVSYYSSTREHQLQEQKYDDDDPIRSDVVETIGKASACLSNCILTGTLIGDSEECTRTWDALFAMYRRAIVSTGGGIPPNDITDAITSCMVVLIRRRPQLLRNDDDLTVLVSSLGSSSPAAGIETQRNVVAMLSTVIAQVAAGAGQDGKKSQASSLTVNESLVRYITDTLVKLLSSYSQHSPQTPQVVSLYGEILNAFMDWYGQDDFFPRTFDELKLSDVIQRTLKHVPASSLSPEEEEVFYNAGRFLEYKQQQ
jgi:hypothetical protein